MSFPPCRSLTPPGANEEYPQFPTRASAEFPFWVSGSNRKQVPKQLGGNCASFTLRKIQDQFSESEFIFILLWVLFGFVCFLNLSQYDISSHINKSTLWEELIKKTTNQVNVSEKMAQRTRGAVYSKYEGTSWNSQLLNDGECKPQYWIKVKLQWVGVGRQKVCYQSHNYLKLASTTNPRLLCSLSFPWVSPPPVESGQCHLEFFVWRLMIHPHQNHTHKTETIKHLPVQVSQNVTYTLPRRPVLNDQREQPGVSQRKGTQLLSSPLHFKQHLIRNTL